MFRLWGGIWNVGEAKRLVAGREPNGAVDVTKHKGLLLLGEAVGDSKQVGNIIWRRLHVPVDEAYAMSNAINLGIPVIAVAVGQSEIVIDGLAPPS